MGSRYQFSCPECGHERVVSGGLDYGFLAVVRTMVCRDCQELVDVLVRAHGQEGETGDPEYDKDIGRCPECHGANVQRWPRSRPCPKCGNRMKKSQEPTVMWD